MRKFLPYLYFAFAAIILVDTIQQFLADKEIYRILFGWKTESKYLFLLIKTAIAGLIFTSGLRYFKLKK